MTKRFLGMFLTLCIVIALLPILSMAGTMDYEAGTYTELINALADTTVSSIKLTSDIIASDVIAITRPVTIDGDGYTIQAIVTGTDDRGVANSSPSSYNIFSVSSSTGLVTLKNMTVKGGGKSAIVNEAGSTLLMNNVVITQSGSSSTYGSGLTNRGNATLTDCAFTRNVANYGGGFINEGANAVMIMDRCSITENRSLSQGGGGCEIKSGATLYMNNSTIANNQSAEIGGGINNYRGNLYLMNSTVTGNVTTIMSSSSSGNAKRGGGIGFNGGAVYIINSIVTDNYSMALSNTYVPSDIGLYSGNISDISVFYSLVGSFVTSNDGTTGTITNDTASTIGSNEGFTVDDVVFSEYAESPLLDGSGNPVDEVRFSRPLLIKQSNNTYAPLLRTDAQYNTLDGGCNVYFAYDENTGVVFYVGYGDSPTKLTGTASEPGSFIDIYQNGQYRTELIRGASGYAGTRYFTVLLSQPENCTVSGISVFGDTFAENTYVTVTATPDAGYLFDGWYNGTTKLSDNVTYTHKVIRDITLTAVVTTLPKPTLADFTYTPPSSDLIYDGLPKIASVTSSNPDVGRITVKYYKDDELVDPIDAGTYTVKIDVESNETYSSLIDFYDSSWSFTIEQLNITGVATHSEFDPLTYNGSAQTPSATVTYGSFNVTGTWSDVTNVTDTTTFTANGNFTGTIADQSAGMKKATPSYTVPTGLTATYGQTLADISLPEGFSWALPPTTSVGPIGTNQFIVIYTPEDTINYNIMPGILVYVSVTAREIAFSIDYIAAVTYNGTNQLPPVTVKDGDIILTKGVHYTLSYSNNTNAGNATVTTTGIGIYAGSTGTKTFTINPLEITYENTTVGTFAPLIYNGTAQTPSAAVTHGTLTVTGTWSKVTNVTDTTTFTANGNFTGTLEGKNTGMAKADPGYTVPTDISAVYGQILSDVSLPAGFAWTTPAASVGNVGTKSFTVTYTPADTVNYNTVNNISVDVAVAPKVIGFSIGDIVDVTYNGTAHTPEAIVIDGEIILTNGVHYTVSYSNNTNAGTATVTVTGKGNYAGSTGTKVFKINRANVTNSKNDLTITYTGQAFDVSRLFTLDSNAGTPSYTIESGGTGEGALTGSMLTITKAGTISIGMTTAQTANGNAGSKITAILTVNKGSQAAPAGITKLNTSVKDGIDGKILNLSTDMEYKSADGEYTAVSGSEISGLSKGQYFIRYKETALYNAGLDTEIIIDEPTVIRVDETVPDGITLETPTQSEDPLNIRVAKLITAPPEIKALSGRKIIPLAVEITAEVNNSTTTMLSNIVKITLPIPNEAKGKGITLYRTRNGQAEIMPIGEKNKNTDGEYAIIGTRTIELYVKSLEQYAVSYTKPDSGSSISISYKITVTQSEGGNISPDSVRVPKNSGMTFTITPNRGYKIQDVLVNGKSVGIVAEYTFKNVVSEASITAEFKKVEETTEEPTKPTTPAKWVNPFKDVNENDWFYDAVKYVSENELMNGISETVFAPGLEVTRAMFVTVIYRAENQPEAGVSPFTDVESGAYYEKAVAWAAENGIVKGISETEFAPNVTITREQMAAIVQRYADYKGFDTAVDNTASYADNANISDYAKEAVAFCTEHGIMGGRGNNLFAPGEDATRAEVASVFARVLKFQQ